MIGEGTTDYFFDRLLIDNRRVDHALPPIPEVIAAELPRIKIFIVLRDPVKRAISAYYHHLAARRFNPYLPLREADKQYPELRIISRGFYGRYLTLWRKYVSEDQMKIYLLEDDVRPEPLATLQNAFRFLEIDEQFTPIQPERSRNEQLTWTHLILKYYLGTVYDYLFRALRKTPLNPYLSQINLLKKPPLPTDDIRYLQEQYLPEREQLEFLLGRSLACWDYGGATQ